MPPYSYLTWCWLPPLSGNDIDGHRKSVLIIKYMTNEKYEAQVCSNISLVPHNYRQYVESLYLLKLQFKQFAVDKRLLLILLLRSYYLSSEANSIESIITIIIIIIIINVFFLHFL